MAKTAYPTTTEVTNRLTGLGVTSIPTGVVLQDVIDAAVARLEKLSGRVPFLKQASAGAFVYNPPFDDVLFLGGVWTDVTEVSVDGTVMVEDTDYWLEPSAGPYQLIRWDGQLQSEIHGVSVTGKRGTVLPVDVFNAVMDWAAGEVYRTAAMVGTVATGTVKRIKQDSVEIEYTGAGSGSSADIATTLQQAAEKVFSSYRYLGTGDSP